MSIGYCGRIELLVEDEFSVIYRYCGENLNDDSETRGDIEALDGEIVIKKSCLDGDIYEALKNGDIEIIRPCTSEATKSLQRRSGGMYFAIKLLGMVVAKYREDGCLPRHCGFMV